MTRRSDSNNSIDGQVKAGDAVYVLSGSVNGSQGFVLSSEGTGTNNNIVFGTDSLTFSQFTGTAALTAGNGLVINGNELNVQSASNSRIIVNVNDIDLATVATNNTNGSNTTNFISSITVDSYGRVTGKETSAVSFSGYATLNDPTFTGNVALPGTTSVGNVSSTEIGYLDGVTSGIQSQLDAKSPLASPTFTGAPTAPTAADGVSNTQIATTAFVANAVANLSSAASEDYIAASIVNAKGDLIVASADDTVGRLPVGTNGNFLKANSSTATGLEWASIPTINNLDDVGDVTITGNATNQFLKYNGSAWINSSVPTINTLDDVGDVTITSAAANQLLQYNGSAWINTSNPTVGGNLTITGNLTVSGTTTTVNSETLTINDNIIVLNNNEAGTPSENAGIEVERGTSTNVLVRWNETDDCWEFTNDGTKYERIVGDTLTSAQTAAYTLVLGDRSKMVEMSVASGHNLTVPTNSNVAFPVGTTITVLQTGAGQTTIAGQSGVTVNATPGLKLRAQWSSATLIKRATDTWVALGDLAA